MTAKELIELLKQYEPETDVAIEYFEIDEYGAGSYSGTKRVYFDVDDCKFKGGEFIINMEDYRYI